MLRCCSVVLRLLVEGRVMFSSTERGVLGLKTAVLYSKARRAVTLWVESGELVHARCH